MRREGYMRLGVGTLDQVTSSLSNVLVVFAIARVSDVRTFGLIGLVLAGTSTALATARGLLGTPIALLSHDPTALVKETRYSATVAMAGGLLIGSVILGLSSASPIASPAAALALSLPVVLTQDVARFHAISEGRPGSALLSDGLWALGSTGILAWTGVHDDVTPVAVIVAWGGAGLLACVLLLAQTRVTPAVRGIVPWARRTWADRLRYGGEATIGATTSLFVAALAAWLLSSEAVAALRGAGTIMGPLSVLMSAITLALVPELRRSGGGTISAQGAWTHLRKVALGLSGLAVAVGTVAWIIPIQMGSVLMGDSWRIVHSILPITALEYAALAWLSGCAAGLRAQGRSRELLRIRVQFGTLTLAFAVCAALLSQRVWGISVALLLAAVVSAVIARRQLLRPELR